MGLATNARASLLAELLLVLCWTLLTSDSSASHAKSLPLMTGPSPAQEDGERSNEITRDWQANSVIGGDECPGSCFCDELGLYVSCVGERAWDLSLPLVPSTVVRLEMRSFRVGTLLPRHLARMPRAEEIRMQETDIESIGDGAFAKQTKLQRLDLSDNRIRNLTSSTFRGLEKTLRYLDLSSNNITVIDEAFLKLVFLEQLNLCNNKLSSLSVSTFLGLNRLQYLNLDNNALANVELGTFIHLPHLAHLLLSNNPLASITRLDSVSTKLQYIDLSNVGLELVPQGIDPFVRDLRLARNRIANVSSGDFDNYPYLTLLVLDDNAIEFVEDDALGRLEYLIRLWLNGNRLERVPQQLPVSLRELYLEENAITVLDANSLRELTSLQRLFLGRNKLHTIESGAFANVFSLNLLDLQSNALIELTSSFLANATRLESLDVSQNNLRVFSGNVFRGLTNLKSLHLSRIETPADEIGSLEERLLQPLANLETLDVSDSPGLAARLLASDKNLAALRTLQEINLMHNKLTSLRSDFPSFFPQLQMIKLNDNAWRCDSLLNWLVQWMKSSSSLHFFLSYEVKCASPASMASKPLMFLNTDEMPLSTASPSRAVQQSASVNGNATTTLIPGSTSLDVAASASQTTSSPNLEAGSSLTFVLSSLSDAPSTTVSSDSGSDAREEKERDADARRSKKAESIEKLFTFPSSTPVSTSIGMTLSPSSASTAEVRDVKNERLMSENATSYYYQSVAEIATRETEEPSPSSSDADRTSGHPSVLSPPSETTSQATDSADFSERRPNSQIANAKQATASEKSPHSTVEEDEVAALKGSLSSQDSTHFSNSLVQGVKRGDDVPQQSVKDPTYSTSHAASAGGLQIDAHEAGGEAKRVLVSPLLNDAEPSSDSTGNYAPGSRLTDRPAPPGIRERKTLPSSTSNASSSKFLIPTYTVVAASSRERKHLQPDERSNSVAPDNELPVLARHHSASAAKSHISTPMSTSSTSSKEFAAFVLMLVVSLVLLATGGALIVSYSMARQNRRVFGESSSCSRYNLRSNVAYSPHKDEVSIVNIAEQDHPRGSYATNRLYLEVGSESDRIDAETELLSSDPLLRELLPLTCSARDATMDSSSFPFSSPSPRRHPPVNKW